VDVDALAERLQGDLFVPLLLGLTCATVYVASLAREFRKTRALAAAAEECRRRIEDEERRERDLGFSPSLGRYRRLEAELSRRLGRR
jgi:hypothetical protein